MGGERAVLGAIDALMGHALRWGRDFNHRGFPGPSDQYLMSVRPTVMPMRPTFLPKVQNSPLPDVIPKNGRDVESRRPVASVTPG
jgi:hypothetical protein